MQLRGDDDCGEDAADEDESAAPITTTDPAPTDGHDAPLALMQSPVDATSEEAARGPATDGVRKRRRSHHERRKGGERARHKEVWLRRHVAPRPPDEGRTALVNRNPRSCEQDALIHGAKALGVPSIPMSFFNTSCKKTSTSPIDEYSSLPHIDDVGYREGCMFHTRPKMPRKKRYILLLRCV